MKIQVFSRKSRFAFLALLTGTLLNLTVMVGTLAAQQTAVSTDLSAPKPPANLLNRTLLSTTFRTSINPRTISCTDSLCENLSVFFVPSVLRLACPGAAGTTCTFYVHVESQASVSANDSGVFDFFVDGIAPSPGPTDIHGFFTWDSADPNSAILQGRSYAVAAQVTNSKTDQQHEIEVQFGCVDLTGDGCSATVGLANLSVGLYTP